MPAAPVIRRRDVANTIGMSRKVIALFEAASARIIRVIDRNRVSPVFAHDCETGNVGGTVTDVDHISERYRANFVGHMVIYVLRHIQKALVDSKQVLSLLRVADNALWEADSALGILCIFATENLPQIRANPAAFDKDFESGGDHKMVDTNCSSEVMFLQQIQLKFLKHLGQAFVKLHFGAELFQLLIRRPVHGQIIQDAFHVCEFVVISLALDQIRAALPEFFGINPESREDDIILHVGRAQRLIIIKDDRDSVLESSHSVTGIRKNF